MTSVVTRRYSNALSSADQFRPDSSGGYGSDDYRCAHRALQFVHSITEYVAELERNQTECLQAKCGRSGGSQCFERSGIGSQKYLAKYFPHGRGVVNDERYQAGTRPMPTMMTQKIASVRSGIERIAASTV